MACFASSRLSLLYRQAAGETPTLPEASASPALIEPCLYFSIA